MHQPQRFGQVEVRVVGENMLTEGGKVGGTKV
ncbi:hypothetical protein HNQ08_004840 [Deinococcus humi]|uniref:Uncharacterized protein n=1 Tax=Deinococcus humi TaxID=662880 RepID=A0A7W8NFR3_9DEIO|nr:hypothetical protein [Deinococcus humi]